MRPAAICGFALHIASLFARQDGEQHALGESSSSSSSSNGRGGSGFKSMSKAAAPNPNSNQPASAPELAPAPPSTPPSKPAAGISVPLFLSLERYARLADIAYCVGVPGSGISRPFSCASRCADFPEVRLLSTWSTGYFMHDSCGFVAVDDSAREIIVAFRGTYSIANTVADLSTVPQKYEPYDPGKCEGKCDDSRDPPRIKCTNCTVHSGFLGSWRSTRHAVLPVVAEARNQSVDSSSPSSPPPSSPSSSGSDSSAPYRVHLIGHSLGGAVAALAALEMKTVLGWEDVMVTTYGEPRVGNGELATFLEHVFGLHTNDTSTASYRRVTHKNDPVPLLPMTDWGYSSHAGEVFIKKLNLSPSPEDVILCRGRNDPDCSDEDGAPDDSDDDEDEYDEYGDYDYEIVDEEDGRDGKEGKDEEAIRAEAKVSLTKRGIIPQKLRLWEMFFAHRDYFWRLGMCVPGSDPGDWGREHYNYTDDEL
ncbi:hypothetical protein SCUCBS95973_005091 [Sporothrix curviconia]|uniref:Fungal lipase-type domain-containing protein n=1 Tax=Sporothrix curviconia TaxID=1260050 RepID=A0ABP0BU11_9PEZI